MNDIVETGARLFERIKTGWLRYVLASGIVLAAAGLRIWPLGALGVRMSWTTFYPAVVAASLFGGFSSGVFATILTAILVLVWSPTGQPFINDSADRLGLAVFIINGTLISLMGWAMHRAVVDQEKSEDALRQISRFPLENPNPVLRMDKSGKVLYQNKPAQALELGSDAQAGMVGRWKEIIRQALVSGEPKIIRESLTDRTFSFSFTPIRETGYVNIYGEDITEAGLAENRLLETEKQLRQSQKMEAVGKLAGGIAHDFNNILTAILGFAEFLKVSCPKNDPRLDDIAEIRKAGERAAMLTRQLLAFSRKQVLSVEIVDINDVISDIHKLLRRTISEQISITVKETPSVPKIKADGSQIGQVLMNLVINASDAMPAGGNITIETAATEFTEAVAYNQITIPAGNYVMFSVTDTGEGIPQENLNRIFEPFFTTKAVGKGTGLGLAMVYGVVKQSGGYITVDSQPGQGACFKVFLPATSKTAGAAQKAAISPDALRGSETILVAEDDAGTRKIAARSLGSFGYTVLEAASSEEALHIFNDSKEVIDLLFTDIVMPGINGTKLAERIRSEHPGIKVIFTSGYLGAETDQHGDLVPGRNFLSKPYTFNDLAEIVRAALNTK